MASTVIPQPFTAAQTKDMAALAFQAICPNNEILYDDLGAPSVMVKIPKMTYAQLGLGDSSAVHPAFIVNNVEKDFIYISKYQNVIRNGRAYSLPGVDETVGVGFDTAQSACAAKGTGWHLMTRAEWAMLALWCKANGTQPKGHNNYGKDFTETVYRAIPTHFTDGKVDRVAAGTGPVSWSHDGTLAGIWDLNGNIWEWVGGMRAVYGELQILANNNAADSGNSHGASSAQWKAVKANNGALVTPNGSGTTAGTVKLDWVSDHLQFDTGISDGNPGDHECDFEAITCSANISDAAKLLLQGLALFKYDAASGAYNADRFFFNNGTEEAFPACGGPYGGLQRSGVFAGILSYPRSRLSSAIGFRSAYVPL